MKQNISFFILFAVLIMIITACSKEEDSQLPSILINQPFENQYFSCQDSIPLDIEVSDDHNLTSVSIVLINDSFVPVMNAMSVQLSQNSIHIQDDYIVDNNHLESGNYYLQVKASDGVNEATLYREVNIEGLEKALKSIIVVTEENVNSAPVYQIDTSGHRSLLFTFNGNDAVSAINSYHQQMVIAGKTEGGVKVFDFNQNDFEWSLPPYTSSSFHSFEAVNCVENEYIVSFTNGNIRKYSHLGSVISGYNPPVSQAAFESGKNGNFLLVDTKLPQHENHDIYVFHYQTGGFLQSQTMPYSVVAFFPKENNISWMWGNDLNDQAILKTYSTSSNLFSSVRTLPTGKLNAVVDAGAQNYLVSIENTIYWYQANINSLTPFMQNISATDMAFDFMNQVVYCAEGNLVKLYRYPLAQSLGTITLPHTITNVILLYNK